MYTYLVCGVGRGLFRCRTWAVEVRGQMRAEEQPHPQAKERHQHGRGIEGVKGKELPVGSIAHVPLGVVILGIDVPSRHILPRKCPVEAHFARGTKRPGAGRKQREQEDAQGNRGETREKGLGVERLAPGGEETRQLGGAGAEARHSDRGAHSFCTAGKNGGYGRSL